MLVKNVRANINKNSIRIRTVGDVDKFHAVLNDCKNAAEKLRVSVKGSQDFKHNWILSVVLLQISKDVIHHHVFSDAIEKKEMAKSIWEEEIKNGHPSIYLEFVNAERNRIVHEYKIGWSYKPQRNAILTRGTAVLVRGSSIMTVSRPEEFQFDIPPYTNRDPVSLVDEAINWLDNVVRRIESL